jgi:hypothetical protein
MSTPDDNLPALIPSLDNFKAVYYAINSKPDTDMRLLSGSKLIAIGDIRFINEQILRVLENHVDYGSTINITLTFSKRGIKEYNRWEEFDRENWNSVNENTKSISMSWDFMIKLPLHQIPQRHTVKVRIGSAIAPKDMFHLVMSSDDVAEVMEAQSEGICKVDFINQALANNLLNVVTSWYEGLKEIPDERTVVQKFMEKHQSLFLYTVNNSIPVLFIILYSFYFPLFDKLFKYDFSLVNIQWVIIGLFSVYTFGIIVSRQISRWLDRKIDSYKRYSQFCITKGDENARTSIKDDNNKITKEIVTRFFWGLFTSSIGIALKYLVEKIF